MFVALDGSRRTVPVGSDLHIEGRSTDGSSTIANKERLYELHRSTIAPLGRQLWRHGDRRDLINLASDVAPENWIRPARSDHQFGQVNGQVVRVGVGTGGGLTGPFVQQRRR
jgi:hypothetical protein